MNPDPRLLIELQDEAGWVLAGILRPEDMAASISNHATGKREIVRFRFLAGHAIIDRSIAGADREEGDLRAIVTTGFETLAHLLPGEDYEMPVVTDQMTRVHQLRFRYAAH